MWKRNFSNTHSLSGKLNLFSAIKYLYKIKAIPHKRGKRSGSLLFTIQYLIPIFIFLLNAKMFPESLLKGENFELKINERLRYEARNVLSYSSPAPVSSDYLFNRLRVGFEWRPSKEFGTFLQIQDSRILGRKPDGLFTPQKKNAPFIIQGYLEFKNIFLDNLTLKIGRQKLSFFSQRLVSPLEWHNVSRTWDAVKLCYLTEKMEFNLFSSFASEAHLNVPKKFDYEDRIFNGITYQFKKIGGHNLNVGFYLFNRIFNDRNFISETGISGNLHDWTYGANITFEKNHYFFEIEITKQSGKRSSDTIDSAGIIAIAGLKVEKFYNYKGFIEISWASGDNNSSDGKLKTFDPLYPFGHEYWGHIDLIGFRNLISYGLRNQWTINKKKSRFIDIYLDFYLFVLDTLKDKWYGVGLVPTRTATTTTTHKEIGKEVDLEFKVYPKKNYIIWLGASAFVPGGFIKDTGFSKTATFSFISFELNF